MKGFHSIISLHRTWQFCNFLFFLRNAQNVRLMGENEQENETVVLRDWMKTFMRKQREGSGRGNAQLSNGIRQFYISRLIDLLQAERQKATLCSFSAIK